MSNLDDALLQLAAVPVPTFLGEIDGVVIAGAARRRESSAARRAMALAGGIAVLVGVAGTILPAAPANAEGLLGVPEAAPSHLLAG
jgi:hypothetical protein